MTAAFGHSEPGLAKSVRAVPPARFALTVFASAALVFSVEPMMARLMLPLLGGSAAVWNTSLAFFQAALLAGYVYAHLLQRLRRIGPQVLIHIAVLILAGLVLPLHVADLFGGPPLRHPALWLVASLVASIGAPFAALSATAPLAQAWHARTVRAERPGEPYALYAASNFGSLIALLAYPTIVEPNLTLHVQAAAWSAGYAAFILLMAGLGAASWRRGSEAGSATETRPAASSHGRWRERVTWLLLAAIPSSLLLGVTSYITTDLGSAPFLWVAPLALYLLTFIIAFQVRQVIRPGIVLALQAVSLAICGVFSWAYAFVPELLVHLTCFFLTALVCHQALVARRPAAERLTDFYVWISVGGVLGGAFSAFVAPVIFQRVIEYPLVLVLSCLARPWGRGRIGAWAWGALAVAVACAAIAILLVSPGNVLPAFVERVSPGIPPLLLPFSMLCVTAVFAFLLRGRALVFMVAICALVVAADRVTHRDATLKTWRDFFGVLTVSHTHVGALGDVESLWHGTTLHGAQSPAPAFACRPLVYYAPETPIGQVLGAVEARKSALRIGAVGLGTGSVAAYTRPGDSLTFFEIDPAVIRVATDPRYFTYTTRCARGAIAYAVGDARLSVAREPNGSFDILLIDAFSSDSVPAHLLTVEAVSMYLSKLRPNGILILHLSNNHLDLMRPAQAVAIAAGGRALAQRYRASTFLWAASEEAVIVGKSPTALAPFLADPRWSSANSEGVRAWTDDYVDLFGALLRGGADAQRAAAR